jgi:hypothetical protein
VRQIERFDEEPRVADLVAGTSAQVPPQLDLERFVAVVRLFLQRCERQVDHLSDALHAERADELALEVGVADLHVLEVAAEDGLFVPVGETGQFDAARDERNVAGDRVRPSEHDDGGAIEAEPAGERFERDAVALALDEDEAPRLPDRG